MRRIRSALFVDFDNIYSGLDEVDTRAATAFATRPGRWLGWIEAMVASTEESRIGEATERSVLVRNMYLNPSPFGRFRPDFTRAGFSVMDCPSLTLQGKSSADIRMVLDIIDTLGHETRFDEFIIFSGDADFTPVLQRLRAHDRRTAILAVNPAAQAYRAAADVQIEPDVFIEAGLGLTIGGQATTRTPRSADVAPRREGTAAPRDELEAVAARVEAAIRTDGVLAGGQLARVLRDFPGFTKESRWLGFGTSYRLAEALVRRRPVLVLVAGEASGEWSLALRSDAVAALGGPVRSAPRMSVPDAKVPVSTQTPASSTALRVSAAPAPPAPPAPGPQAAPTGTAPLGSSPPTTETPTASPPVRPVDVQIAEAVAVLVDNATTPISLGAAAQHVTQKLGDEVRRTRWGGHGSFKALIEHFTFDPPIEISNEGPGYLVDPERHQRPVAPDEATLAGASEALSTLARRIANVTGAPFLTPEAYRTIFEALAHVASQGPFQIGPASIAARDECAARGFPISRQSVQFVIKGVGFAGYRFDERANGHVADAIAGAFRDNIRKLCSNAQLVLTDEEGALLDDWLLGRPSGAGG